MASESIAHSAAIDSEPIWARGIIIVKYVDRASVEYRLHIGRVLVEYWLSIDWCIDWSSVNCQSTFGRNSICSVGNVVSGCIGGVLIEGGECWERPCILIKLCGSKCQLQFCEVQCNQNGQGNQFFSPTCFAHNWTPYFLLRKFLFRS